ncbi:MAG: class I SAM-dependent methyltransferase [Mycobacterium sp.]
MSAQRTEGDSWDIASGVGRTALMAAAMRAAESSTDQPLFDDPLAKLLVEGAGSGAGESMLDGIATARQQAADSQSAATFLHICSYLAVRTHFFDAFFDDAVAAGIRQVVILASGLDSRAYRLGWPAGTVVFEIDQPDVLRYKTSTLDDHGVAPTAVLHDVPVDLRDDWPTALTGAGFDPRLPTAWLAEGLLMYLPAHAQDRLFEFITELSATGSWLAAEALGHDAQLAPAERRERMSGLSEQLSATDRVDVNDLMYADQHRADVADWLNGRGWRAVALSSRDEMQRLGRLVESSSVGYDGGGSTFVVAKRG